MKVSVVQSTVQVVFGVIDDEGDVIQKQPLTIEITKLGKAAMDEVLAKVAEAREKLNSQLNPPTPEAVVPQESVKPE